LLLGLAYQLGHVPIPAAAIEQAIELNGAAVEMNKLAFRYGRLSAHDPAALGERGMASKEPATAHTATLEEIVSYRSAHLARYQDEALAERYRRRVEAISKLEKQRIPTAGGLAVAVAKAYHKLLAIKDEYEVARLYTDGTFQAEVAAHFDGVESIDIHLAPPLLARFWKDKVTGHPRKIRLPGKIVMPLFRLLARAKRLRGSRWDVFGMSRERRREREMIAEYEGVLDEIANRLSQNNHATATALASLPLQVKGFGHIKLDAANKARQQQATLLAQLRTTHPPDRTTQPTRISA
jgi:indolepyruvate ferredoxin oxidoreductase